MCKVILKKSVVACGVRDYAVAAKWWRKAAEQGEASAQFRFGLMYGNGKGVIQDYAEAAKWYRKMAEHGVAGAQYILGAIYNEGEGVTQDYAEAVKWYRKAAEQGLPIQHIRPIPIVIPNESRSTFI
ncbi:sel1 repeat family protein [Alphaproteobacteria bacterium]|nr:sel1 repeat family protein [Alphaproteobacteria bacterium]